MVYILDVFVVQRGRIRPKRLTTLGYPYPAENMCSESLWLHQSTKHISFTIFDARSTDKVGEPA